MQGNLNAQTPLMRQYLDIKREYQDSIVFFRLGDFYEMFFEDATLAAPILDIALTSRDKTSASPIPLCGVPYHNVTPYISKLLEHGHKVAICEQVEDVGASKGIVKREVVRVITPGLQTDTEGLSADETRFVAALCVLKTGVGFSYLDASSGKLFVGTVPGLEEGLHEMYKLSPKEVLVFVESPKDKEKTLGFLKSFKTQELPDWILNVAHQKLSERFEVASSEALGLSHLTEHVSAYALIYFAENLNKMPMPHLCAPQLLSWSENMQLDSATVEHLDLFPKSSLIPVQPEESLYGILNQTQTKMGARKLREWMLYPLMDSQKIQARLDAVSDLVEKPDTLLALSQSLKEVYDLERLLARVASGRAHGRDLVQLQMSLEKIPSIKDILQGAVPEMLQTLSQALNPHSDLSALLKKALEDEPPYTLKEGGMIRQGFDAALDELKALHLSGKAWLANLETQEKQKTGIASLKIKYNRVFGYSIEVTSAHLSKVPAHYIRKQTLTNGERYITQELKIEEEKILSASEKMVQKEFELFEGLRRTVTNQLRSLQTLSTNLSLLDVLCSFARVAKENQYCKPTINHEGVIEVMAARHPMVEKITEKNGEIFIPNDMRLSPERQMVILTGPNMSGKSTAMRQLGLCTLMMQMGSFVPGAKANISICDQVFSRVGASDNLARGQSTFMVEMVEAANILKKATTTSLVLLDEVGRGTSTYDGLSIAWAMAEHLAEQTKCKTLFATHYHELTALSQTHSQVHNMSVEVKEWNGKIIFLHKLIEGAASRSYGIEVAKLAGVPQRVIERAKSILSGLEQGQFKNAHGNEKSFSKTSHPEHLHEASTQKQFQLFQTKGDELCTLLGEMKLDELSPKEALDQLYQLKQKIFSN